MGKITVALPQFKYIGGIIVANLVFAGLILLFRNNIPPTVPLFYGRPRGDEQLAPQIFLLIPPLACVIVAIINGIITYLVEDKFIQKVMLGISFAATLLSTITIIKIILLVGNF